MKHLFLICLLLLGVQTAVADDDDPTAILNMAAASDARVDADCYRTAATNLFGQANMARSSLVMAENAYKARHMGNGSGAGYTDALASGDASLAAGTTSKNNGELDYQDGKDYQALAFLKWTMAQYGFSIAASKAAIPLFATATTKFQSASTSYQSAKDTFAAQAAIINALP